MHVTVMLLCGVENVHVTVHIECCCVEWRMCMSLCMECRMLLCGMENVHVLLCGARCGVGNVQCQSLCGVENETISPW